MPSKKLTLPERIGHDPRNLTWSNDTNRFSYKHMTALGWTDKSGLGGSNLSGDPNHIAVVRKLDNGGIGTARARKEGEELSAGAGQAGRGLEDVLKRLSQASGSTGEEPKVDGQVSVVLAPNRMA
jgi:Pin2-interacting protein X1